MGVTLIYAEIFNEGRENTSAREVIKTDSTEADSIETSTK